MFWHIFKYRLKALFHEKSEFFWNMIFPLILATCFYAAFSNITKSTESFSTIPVAVVLEDTATEEYFVNMMDGLSQAEGDEVPFFLVQYCSLEEGEALLKDKEVEGLILMKEGKPTLTVIENGIYQTMIKAVLDKYVQTMDIVTQMIPAHANKLEEVTAAVSGEVSFLKEKKLTDGNTDLVLDYFFGLIAMTCLMGTTTGQYISMHIKANLSGIGLRKSISSANRMTMVLADFASTFTMAIAANTLLLIYLKYILKLNLGAGFWEILPVTMAGSLIAISLGMLVGFLPKLGEGGKLAINISFTLFSSFLSGLMMGGIKYMIEKNCPIINRINPATLISDALHSLNIYDTYEKYTQCMITMIIMSVVLFIASILIARRETYDSI